MQNALNVLHAVMHHGESACQVPQTGHQSLASCELNATLGGCHLSNSMCVMLQETFNNQLHVLQQTTNDHLHVVQPHDGGVCLLLSGDLCCADAHPDRHHQLPVGGILLHLPAAAGHAHLRHHWDCLLAAGHGWS